MTATTQQRDQAKSDPMVARALLPGLSCDRCPALAVTFLIDGETTEFACRDHYLVRARERQAETAALRRSRAGF